MRLTCRFGVILAWSLAVAAGGAPRAHADQTTIHRFALIVGANHGGNDRVRLRYASSDARQMARVLDRFGGVPQSQRLVLSEPDLQVLESAFTNLGAMMTRSRTRASRVELVFYYSGHSDERGLLLRGERFTYDALKQSLARLDADVRIAILDSCASGALTRTKGGVRRAAFLIDASSQVSGHAYLTSASADEAAQESDRLGGSFFTHALLTGLRGAADRSGDGRVTLGEAYQFAFHETLARTEGTQSGPQHPNYDFQLAGSGDLVLTDLRGTSAKLVLDESLDGRLFVRDGAGALIAELRKPAGRAIELGLEPGVYQITLEQPAQVKRAQVNLEDGRQIQLASADLHIIETEPAVARGDAEPVTTVSSQREELIYIPAAAMVVPGIGTNSLIPGKRYRNNVIFGAVIAETDVVEGAAGSLVGNITNERHEGAQGAAIFNTVGGDLRGVQGAGVFNAVEGHVEGVQASGVMGHTGQSFRGVQASGVFSYAEGPFQGVQAGTVGTYTGGEAVGAQLAAVVNISEGPRRGVQVASVVNLSSTRIVGAQLMAVVNAAEVVDGAQIGLVNVADEVDGLQIGLVNIADSVDGASIGLLPLIGDGLHHLDVWSNEAGAASAGLKLGSRYTYALWAGGLLPTESDTMWFVGLGLGARVPLGRLFLDLDLMATAHRQDGRWNDRNLLTTARVMLGLHLTKHFAIFGGPTFNSLYTFDGETPLDLGIDPMRTERSADPNMTVGMWPGLVLGIEI